MPYMCSTCTRLDDLICSKLSDEMVSRCELYHLGTHILSLFSLYSLWSFIAYFQNADGLQIPLQAVRKPGLFSAML